MVRQQLPDLYWTEGPFRVALQCPANTPQHLYTKTISLLEDYRSDCQRQFCAFSGSVNGRLLAYDKFSSLLKSRDNTFFVGTGKPDTEQRLGRSTIAQMRQGDFLNNLKAGGAFEDQNAKAFIVMIFHRWDDQFRYLIAKVLSVPKSAVQCDLMGDVRHIRNSIIHEDSEITDRIINKLRILPLIWTLQPGKLRINNQMIHSLMEQVNAIRVRVAVNS